MKRLFLLFFSVIAAMTNFAQLQSAKVLLESEIFSILEQEGILLTPAQKNQTKLDNGGPLKWKNENQRNKAIDKDNKLRQYLQDFFQLPSFCKEKNFRSDLIFRNKKIGKLGSYIILNNNLTILNNKIEADLPVLETGTQMSVPNPLNDGSNYRLNFTSSKLFTLANKANVGIDIKELFNAKLNQSLKIDNSAKQQISIAAGVFENQLGNIFKKVIGNSLQPQDFPTIYELWLLHKNGRLGRGDKVISSFEGMAFYSSVGVTNDNDLSFDASINSSGKFPFLSFGLDGSSKWVKSETFTKQSNIYNVYMFSPPETTDIPTSEQILTSWKTMTNFRSSIKVQNKVVSVDIPQILQVKFGPIPNPDILPLVELDEQYSLSKATGTKFLGKLELVKDLQRIKVDDETGYFYTFDIEVTRDENLIAAGQNLPSIITSDVPIRLYINNPVGNKYLDHIYDKVQLTTDTYPTPYFTETDGNLLKPEKEANSNNTVFKANISFKCPESIVIGTASRPLKVVDVIGLPVDANPTLKTLFTTGRIRALGNNNYELKFIMQYGKDYFDKNISLYDLNLVLDFGVGSMNYLRRLSFTLEPPAEVRKNIVIQAQNELVKDNEQLLALLNPDAVLKNGKKCSELKSEFMKDGQLDVISFVEELKKQTNLTVTDKNEYSINSIYLVKSKQ